MKNRCEEWQQPYIQDKAERPEPVKPETGGTKFLNPKNKTLKAAEHRHLGNVVRFLNNRVSL